MLAGKAILVRFVISNITAASCHFEQAFSGDGGRSWEVNWIATDTQDASFHHGADGEHLGGQGSRVPATRSIKNISPDLGGVA